MAVPVLEETEEKGHGERYGRPRFGREHRKGARREVRPSPFWKETQKRGTARGAAVPVLEGNAEKGHGEGRRCPRFGRKHRKGARRRSALSPLWMKQEIKGWTRLCVVPVLKKRDKT
ncbi:hypothetical protein J8TS2_35890 [Lederbergia ruris]|uniref:Uncharacterized protein n=1 Tax=Lederbergia ruris TaxID=217495 RepID=A0ABQ4KMW1_9BACI|nr:hypothetical protein J8TS2_35890 [Lederbergia ruris]